MNLRCFFDHDWKQWEIPGQLSTSKISILRCSRCGKAPLLKLVLPGIALINKMHQGDNPNWPWPEGK